mgnify:CR=1 FL=1
MDLLTELYNKKNISENTVADDGLPPDAGIELGKGRLLEQGLRLLQRGLQADADAQKTKIKCYKVVYRFFRQK